MSPAPAQPSGLSGATVEILASLATHRALSAAVVSPLDTCGTGPLDGVARSVIGACVSQGTFSIYGGRLPPGGI